MKGKWVCNCPYCDAPFEVEFTTWVRMERYNCSHVENWYIGVAGPVVIFCSGNYREEVVMRKLEE